MSTQSTPLSATARLVPGAPPPSKSQKKKKSKSAKKTSEQEDEHTEVPDTEAAALIDHAPTESEVREGSVAPELIVRSTSTRPVSPSADDKDGKSSALVEMLNKRLKATNKKVVCTCLFVQLMTSVIRIGRLTLRSYRLAYKGIRLRLSTSLTKTRCDH